MTMECDCIKQLQQELRKKFNDSEEVDKQLPGYGVEMNKTEQKAFERLIKEGI